MTDEPFGHRGHPSDSEADHARRIAPRLGAAVVVLRGEGFSEHEAIAFIAGLAHEIATTRDGETWQNVRGAVQTIDNILAGGAAKWWSMSAITRALDTVAELVADEEPS